MAMSTSGVPIEERQSHLFAVVDTLLEVLEEWVESDETTVHPGTELWQAIDETIFVFADEFLPASCRGLEKIIDLELRSAFEQHKNLVEKTGNDHVIAPNSLWRAIDRLADERRATRPHKKRVLEPILRLINDKVSPSQICRMYEWMETDGSPQLWKLDEEIAKPGTWTGKNFVHPLDRKDKQREAREQEIFDRNRQRRDQKLAAAEITDPTSIDELVAQGISARQIAKNKRIPVEEVYRLCEEMGIEAPSMDYADLRTVRGPQEPPLNEETLRQYAQPSSKEATEEEAETYRQNMGNPARPVSPPSDRTGPATKDATDMGDTEDEIDTGAGGAISLENEIVICKLGGIERPSDIASACGNDVSVQKVVAVLKRYEAHPEEFNIPAEV